MQTFNCWAKGKLNTSVLCSRGYCLWPVSHGTHYADVGRCLSWIKLVILLIHQCCRRCHSNGLFYEVWFKTATLTHVNRKYYRSFGRRENFDHRKLLQSGQTFASDYSLKNTFWKKWFNLYVLVTVHRVFPLFIIEFSEVFCFRQARGFNIPHIFFLKSNVEQGSTVITEQPKTRFILNYGIFFCQPVKLPYPGNVWNDIGYWGLFAPSLVCLAKICTSIPPSV